MTEQIIDRLDSIIGETTALLAETEGGGLNTIAMLELEVAVDLGEPARLHIQLELREQPGPKPPEYFARLRINGEEWQAWQPAELAVGAPPVTSGS